MPRSCPHHLALFSLVPANNNKRAKDVVAHPDNGRLVSTMRNGELGLDVGLHIRGKSSKTLATLGRGINADIYVAGSSIARVQCSFEIDQSTGIIMFCDKSFARSSQVSGENAIPFERERVRQILVQQGFNTIIGMGGESRNLIQFRLDWHQDPTRIAEKVKLYHSQSWSQLENPRLAQTLDEAPTEVLSRRETRVHSPGPHQQLKMRYITQDLLGSGHFGNVYQAIDVDSGKFMAVKVLRRPVGIANQKAWKESFDCLLKREVETLSKISHPHIVNFIASQGWDQPKVEIFMGLKVGTLESLIGRGADVFAITSSVFPQMLRALDCLANLGIIHRDLKPANILYSLNASGQPEFQLGDFGLCNRVFHAVTEVGTPLFMAPEVRQCEPQTAKVDVWSLFVTMLWTLDVNGFRQTRFANYTDAQVAVSLAASNAKTVSPIKEMAIINPEKRASAAQMLVKCFNGEGLSTKRTRVPPLPVDSSPATTRAPGPAPTAFSSRQARGNSAQSERKSSYGRGRHPQAC